MSTPQYLMLKAGGVRARMSILANAAASTTAPGANMPPSLILADWRAARERTFNESASMADLWQGFNTDDAGNKTPVWISHAGPQFRNESDASEVDCVRMNHRGWFCDQDQSERCIAIVACLSHGRWLAGYRLTDSGERVYFGKVFDDVTDAAAHADGEAEEYAEKAYEHDVRWCEAGELKEEIADTLRAIRLHFGARNRPDYGYDRTYITDAIAEVREMREMRAKLARDYSDIEV